MGSVALINQTSSSIQKIIAFSLVEITKQQKWGQCAPPARRLNTKPVWVQQISPSLRVAMRSNQDSLYKLNEREQVLLENGGDIQFLNFGDDDTLDKSKGIILPPLKVSINQINLPYLMHIIKYYSVNPNNNQRDHKHLSFDTVFANSYEYQQNKALTLGLLIIKFTQDNYLYMAGYTANGYSVGYIVPIASNSEFNASNQQIYLNFSWDIAFSELNFKHHELGQDHFDPEILVTGIDPKLRLRTIFISYEPGFVPNIRKARGLTSKQKIWVSGITGPEISNQDVNPVNFIL